MLRGRCSGSLGEPSCDAIVETAAEAVSPRRFATQKAWPRLANFPEARSEQPEPPLEPSRRVIRR